MHLLEASTLKEAFSLEARQKLAAGAMQLLSEVESQGQELPHKCSDKVAFLQRSRDTFASVNRQ